MYGNITFSNITQNLRSEDDAPAAKPYIMTQPDSNAGCAKTKVAKSRFLLISELTSNPTTDQVNWDDVIPGDIPEYL
jgi:hypothetical protein